MKERTKTQGTITEYTSRVVTMARRVDCPHNSPDFPDALIKQLLNEKTSISKATWFKKKASLIYYFEQVNRDDLIEKLQALSPEGALSKSSNTSGRKKKSLTKNEEDKIRFELEKMAKSPGTWGRQLLSYTECILLTGMRPIELHGARLFASSQDFISEGNDLSGYSGKWPMLHIHNGKQTNGRSFGIKRHVDLSQLNKKQLLFIKLSLAYANSLETPAGQATNYKQYYDALRHAFSRVIKKLFSGRSSCISLYTYRHQCIADMKADNNYSLLQIAAIVGHGNDLTATEHYGRKRSGRSREEKVLANPDDVAKVRPLLDSKMSKVETHKPN
tara:strand:- start:366 stop:1358 length:993 start_codon:yes stop_codon:yes gene_type:complete